MKRRWIVMVAAIVATGLVVVRQWLALHDVQAAERGERMRLDQLERQLQSAMSERDQALAASKVISDSALKQPDGAREVGDWLASVQRLKGLFDAHPDARIPELVLLDDLDWAQLALQARVVAEGDERVVLSRIREAAFSKFRLRLVGALRDFAASHGTPINSLDELLPYLKAPIDAAMLGRYEIADLGEMSPNPGKRMITERVAVDHDFDVRHSMSVDGLGGGEGPWVFESMRPAMAGAMREYAAANGGKKPQDPSALLPYIHDATTRALMDATAQFELEHHRQPGADVTEILPYVKDPNVAALLKNVAIARRPSSP